MSGGPGLLRRFAAYVDDWRKGPARLRRLGRRMGEVEARLDGLAEALARLEALERSLEGAVSRLEAAAPSFDPAGFVATEARLSAVLTEHRRETRAVLAGLSLPDEALWRGRPDQPPAAAEDAVFPRSVVCRQRHFEQPWFADWSRRMGEPLRYHRKLWEFVFIAQALAERGQLADRRRALGFGVGREPLPALFAALGCRVLATDLGGEEAAVAGWVQGSQHAAGRESLRRPDICPDAVFGSRVDFQVCDMAAFPDGLSGFDFCWSACALEHLGSIEAGLDFIERSVETLRPGGWAVHTTEFNLGSDDETLDNAGTVLFRRRDLLALGERLARRGHVLAPLDLAPGDGPIDRFIDTPPYRAEPHLRLALAGWPTTSVGLIVQRSPRGRPLRGGRGSVLA